MCSSSLNERLCTEVKYNIFFISLNNIRAVLLIHGQKITLRLGASNVCVGRGGVGGYIGTQIYRIPNNES